MIEFTLDETRRAEAVRLALGLAPEGCSADQLLRDAVKIETYLKGEGDKRDAN